VRRQLGGVLRVRRVPELEFVEDHSLEQAMRIEALLREVRREDGDSGEDGADPEDPEG
jgi:ribosome-binding factor A